MIKRFANRIAKLMTRLTNRRSIRGIGNKVRIPLNIWMKNSRIQTIGDNNSIIVSPMVRLNGVKFYIKGSNNVIDIQRDVTIDSGSVLWIEGNSCAITIGEQSTFGSVHLAATEDGSSIAIGRDCMFSDDIDIRTGDSHSIIDLALGERINHAKDVVIGNHVWCGAHSSILKGANIPEEVVVATRSIVTDNGGGYSQNTIIGGSPAKTIKENITWERERE